MQVYRGMEIGTAQPTEAERGGVPHLLMGVAEPHEVWHAGRFAEEARAAIAAEARAGRRCLVVGGTGLWLRALREGLFEGVGRDEAIRAELRQVLQDQGAEGLHRELARVDARAAERLRPADHVRVLRALEVHRLTGRSILDWWEDDARRRAMAGPAAPLFVLVRERAVLHERIAARVRRMLEEGWLAEADRLRAMNLPEHAPPRKALGYRTLFDVLEGRLSLDDAREAITIQTRQFARRQEIWFRAERDGVAVGEDQAAAAIEAAMAD